MMAPFWRDGVLFTWNYLTYFDGCESGNMGYLVSSRLVDALEPSHNLLVQVRNRQ